MSTPESVRGEARMRPRSRLITLLGDELISDEGVAVVELVKNAYDADSTKVKVKFESDSDGIPVRLIIEDDGAGMSLDTVLHAWFEPGTDLKKNANRSPGGRLYQGAKGVGRFAAARLGESLFLETRERGANQAVTVLLEWGSFDADSYLDEILITYESGPIASVNVGTKLTIEAMQKRKLWREEDFQQLHDRLSRLISPFDEITQFSIDLEIPNFPDLTGSVEPHPLTRNPKYRFKGSLSATGVLAGDIQVEGKLLTKVTEASIAVDKAMDCGPFEFEIRAWDRDRPGLSPYMLKFGKSLTDVRDILNAYSGVSIYRDGFRVHPYGERGNDWLGLDNRSRQNPTARFASNQVVASVRLSRELNKELKDRTTREGLVHNSAYQHLIENFLSILQKLEEERYRIRPREDAKPEYTTSLFEAFDLSEVSSAADHQLGKAHPIAKLVRDKDQEIRVGVVKLQEHYSRVLLAAGLGQLVDLVVHEIGAPLGRINREIEYLSKLLQKSGGGPSNPTEVKRAITDIKIWLEQIATLRKRLDPRAAGRRGRLTTFDVSEEIIGNLNLFENLIAKQKIEVKFKEPKTPIIVHMARSNLGQIVANLLDNSIYWLTRHHGDGKGGQIVIDLKSNKSGFEFRFCDDGPGIPARDRDRVFEQYFTTKPNGMGLGLYIARQVVEQYGKLSYDDGDELRGACFEVVLSRNVGL
jgi:signal transduction histidine kinase